MKIVYFSSDLYMNCLEVFKSRNDELIAIFIADKTSRNKNIIDYAERHKIECFYGKPSIDDIKNLEEQGVECFVSIEYQYKIPLPSAGVYTLNVHPTLLPEGRGATPLNYLILKYPQYAGITFHKLAHQFDEGDIVLQEKITLDKSESIESLFIKLNLKIAPMLNRILAELPDLYKNSTKQGKGSYWPKISDKERVLNWFDSINSIRLMIRAFGRFGVYACLESKAYLVNHLDVIEMLHHYETGQLITNDDQVFSVAVEGGVVIIYKNSVLECLDVVLEEGANQ